MATKNAQYTGQKNIQNFSNEYNTEEFTVNDEPVPSTTKQIPKEEKMLAAQCGKYFEFAVIQGFRKLSHVSVDSEETADSTVLSTSADPTVVALKQSIDAASDAVVRAFDAKFTKEMQARDYQVRYIADVTTGTGRTIGNPTGDIQAVVNGLSIILELKWQTQSGADVAYFHRVSDETLFGSPGFKGYIADHAFTDNYWNHVYTRDEWKLTLGQKALYEYMETFGDATAQVQYLLAKGQVAQKYKDTLIKTKNAQDMKYVVHGEKATVTIPDIAELAKALTRGLDKDRQARGRITKRGVKTAGFSYTRDGETMATLLINYFGKIRKQPFNYKTVSNQKEAVKQEIKDRANFKFKMYINAKAFQDFGNIL